MGVLYMDSPLGRLKLVSNGDRLTEVRIASDGKNGDESGMLSGDNAERGALSARTLRWEITAEEGEPVMALAARELDEYFAGKRQSFDVPLCPEGTDFERLVWGELCRLPFGECVCYSELAARIGHPSACRAVGSAVGKNPLLILIPCHRVLAKGQKLGGFSAGIERKKLLLGLENIPYFERKN